MRKILAFLIAALLILVDQITKILITTNFEIGESRTVIPNILTFTYIRNPGAAFGILADHRWVFMSITTIVLIVCAALIIHGKFIKSKLDTAAVILIFAGGVGNMIDRTFRGDFLEGSVIDFFNLSFFPAVFNVADVLVVIGASIIIFAQIRSIFFGKKIPKAEPTAEANQP